MGPSGTGTSTSSRPLAAGAAPSTRAVTARTVDASLGAYALVEVDTEAGTGTVSLRDERQGVLANFADPTVPLLHVIE